MSCQIVHHYGNLLPLIDLTEFSDKATEYFRVHSTVVLLEIFEATSFTDCRNDCCVPSIHPFDCQPNVFIALTPLLRDVCSLCEHSLVKPDYFSLLLDCSAKPLFHDVSEAFISTIVDSPRHLGDFYRLALD